MKVYALYSNYFNGVDFWDTLQQLYSKEDDAYSELIRLESLITDSGQSYHVQEMEVI